MNKTFKIKKNDKISLFINIMILFLDAEGTTGKKSIGQFNRQSVTKITYIKINHLDVCI